VTPSINSRRVAFAIGATLSLASSGVAHAAPARPHARLLTPPKTSSSRVVRFAAPADHALVESGVVPVSIAAGPQVSGVKVYAGTKDISARFTRHGSTFTGQIPRSLLKTGTNTLLVQAKDGGAARISIVVAGSTSAAMRMATGAHAASVGDTPDLGYLPSDPGQIPVAIHTKAATYAKLTVNGHTVSDLRASRPLKDHHWLVSLSDGLRLDTNRLIRLAASAVYVGDRCDFSSHFPKTRRRGG
jgi:hypothetical protein